MGRCRSGLRTEVLPKSMYCPWNPKVEGGTWTAVFMISSWNDITNILYLLSIKVSTFSKLYLNIIQSDRFGYYSVATVIAFGLNNAYPDIVSFWFSTFILFFVIWWIEWNFSSSHPIVHAWLSPIDRLKTDFVMKSPSKLSQNNWFL